MRLVALSALRLRGGGALRARKNEAAGGPSQPRVRVFPGLNSPKAERLAAFVLLLFTALCAIIAVAGDLLGAAFLVVAVLQQTWALAWASSTHLIDWLAEHFS